MTSATSAEDAQTAGDKDVWSKSAQQFESYNDTDTLDERTQLTTFSKTSSKFFDPCQDFANASIKCMTRNAGDKDMCQDYFK